MSTPVTVYSSDDLGAPQVIEGRPSEYLEVLKKCLVEGYGSKPGAGWLLAHTQVIPPFLALKNDTTKGASGGFIVFEAADNEPNTFVKGNYCYDWVSIGNASNLGPNIGIQASTTNPADIIKNWLVIATYYGFYIFAYKDSQKSQNALFNSTCICFFAGDLIPTIPNDPSRFITASGNIPTTSLSIHHSLTTRLPRTTSAASGEIFGISNNIRSQYYLSSLFGLNNGSTQAIYRGTSPDIKLLSPVIIITGTKDRYNSLLCNDLETPYCRGIMPGAHISAELGYSHVPMPHFKTINNISYWQIPDYSSDASGAWINMEEW
tara:strand:- start:2413 stop:3372 length:960 start_codon:yes stop_codon:yes gene_type:complete